MFENIFVHKTAIIDEGCTIGSGSKIWHFSHIMAGAQIGNDCTVGQNVFIGDGVRMGNRVKVQNSVSLYGGLEIEDDVFLGPSCVFTNIKTPRAFINRHDKFVSTFIGKGASIGANATIICGVRIDNYAMIGAGAVVSKSVPAHALVIGVPAVQKGWVCICGMVLPDTSPEEVMQCAECRAQYKVKGSAILVL